MATLWMDPYPNPPKREINWGVESPNGIWNFQRQYAKFGLWWHDLACLIANETDREGVFSPIEGHPLGNSTETSPMAMFLSFQDIDGHYEYFRDKPRRPSMEEWAQIKLWGGQARLSFDVPEAEKRDWIGQQLRTGAGAAGGFLDGNYDYQGFHYFTLYAWTCRPGYGTHSHWWPNHHNSGYQIRPDIWPHVTYKARDSGKTRVCDAVTYRGLADKKPAEIRKWRAEATLLLEAKEEFNLSKDPATLDDRGRRFWGYYEKFLLQRLRMPFYRSEMYQYGWFHQANYRMINAPKKVLTRTIESTDFGPVRHGFSDDPDVATYGQKSVGDGIVFKNKMGCSWKPHTRPDQHRNRGFSYQILQKSGRIL